VFEIFLKHNYWFWCSADGLERIYNGFEPQPHSWPWLAKIQVSLFFLNPCINIYKPFFNNLLQVVFYLPTGPRMLACGGALISDRSGIIFYYRGMPLIRTATIFKKI
jgi:hypothetical protein